MGMSIDKSISWITESILNIRKFQLCISDKLALKTAIETMRKYQKMQADYEARLKADMVAMLTDIQLEIKELWDNRYDVWLDNQYYIGKSDTLEEVDEVIQQKINALKAGKRG